MANELAIRVKVDIDTNKKALDQQFNKIKEQYEKSPVKIAFTANATKTKANINSVLKDLVDNNQIKVPEIALKFKVNGKTVTTQIKSALEAAGKDVGDVTSKANKDFQSQFNKLLTLKKSIGNLQVSKINTDPNSTIVLKELDKQIAETTTKYEALKKELAGKINADAMKEFVRQETELNTSLQKAQDLARAKVQQEVKDQAEAYDHVAASISNLTNTMSIYRNQVNDLQKSIPSGTTIDTSSFENFSTLFDDTLNNNGFKDQSEKYRALQDIATSANQELRKLKSSVVDLNKATRDSTGFSNLSSQIRDFISNTPRLKENTELYQKFLNLLNSSDNKAGNIDILRKSFAELRNETKQLGLESETTYGKLSKLFGEHFQTALVMAGIHGIEQGLRAVYENVVEIDSAMTELKKVTDETDATYSNFLDGAASKSRDLGASISDYISSTAEWARLGYNLEDSEELAKVSTLYHNIGDGIESASQASEYLISTLRGFGIAADDAEHVLDVINEVANTQPVSEQGLGEILTRASAAMAAANNTFEETVALGTAMNSVIQDEDQVGTTLKTVSMYLRAAKTDAEAAGVATDGMASSVSELRDELLKLTDEKVDIMADNTTFKSTYEIMKELSEVWEDLSDVDQANILEMLGGKRNANAVQALISNFSIAESSLESAMNSAGSAAKENERYLDSISGRIAQLNSAFEQLSTTLLDSGLVKGIVSFATGVVDATNSVVELTGALPALVSILTTLASLKIGGFNLFSSMNGSLDGLKKSASVLSGLPSIVQSFQAFGTNKIIVSSANDIDILKDAVDGLSDSEKEAVLHLVKFNAGSKEANQALTAQLASTLGLTTATKAATVAQTAWNSVLLVGRSLLLGLGIGAAVLVIQKLVGVIDDVVHAQENAKTAMQETSGELKTSNENLTNLNTQLSDTKDKIQEIQKKGTLSIADKEDLKTLQEENQQLQLQIALEEQKNKQTQKQLEQDTNNLVEKSYGNEVPGVSVNDVRQGTLEMDGILNPNDAVLNSVNGDLEKSLVLYNEFIQKRQEAFSSGDTDSYNEYDDAIQKLNSSLTEQMKELQGIKESYDEIGYDNLSSEAQGYYDSVSESLSTLLYYLDRVQAFDLVSSNDQYADAKAQLESYVQATGADFKQLKTYLNSGAYSDAVEEYVAAMEQAGFSTSEVAAGIIDSMNAAGDSVDGYASKMSSLNEHLDEIQSAYQSVRGAIDEYNQTGILSADTVQTLMSLSPQYTQYLFNEQGQLEINSGTLEKVRQGYISLTAAVYEQCKAVQVEEALRKIKTVVDTKTANDYLNAASDMQDATSTNEELLAQLWKGIADARRAATSTPDSEYTVQMEEAWSKIFNETKSSLDMWDKLAEYTQKNTDAALNYTPKKQKTPKQKNPKQQKKEITDVISAWKSLYEVMDEYNSYGEISFETLGSLVGMSSQLTECLVDQNGQLSINIARFRELVAAQLAETVTSEDAKNNASELARMLEWLDENAQGGIVTLDQFRDIVEGVGTALDDTQDKVDEFAGAIEPLYNLQLTRNNGKYFTKDDIDNILDASQAFDKLNVSALTAFNGIKTDSSQALDQLSDDANQYESILDQISSSKYAKYGNIDNMNRKSIEWTDENIQKYADFYNEYKDMFGEELSGYSTVLGSDEDIEGTQIAFTPLLQTDTGLVPLTQDQLWDYLDRIIDKAYDAGGGVLTADNLLSFDATGLDVQIGDEIMHVSNMIAAVEGQIVDGAKLTAADVSAIAGWSADELMDYYGESSEYVGHSMHDIQSAVTEAREVLQKETPDTSPEDTTPKTNDFFGLDYSAIVKEVTDKITDEINGLDEEKDAAAISILEATKKAIEDGDQSAFDYLLGDSGATLDIVTQQMDAFEEKYNTINNAIQEYNKYHALTQDTMQDLAEVAPDYQKYLVQEGNQLKFNTEVFKEDYKEMLLYMASVIEAAGGHQELVDWLRRLANGLQNIDAIMGNTIDVVDELKSALSDLTSLLNSALGAMQDQAEKDSNDLKIWGQAVQDEIQDRIEALKDQKEALKDKNDEEERAIKLAQLQDELEKARANKTVRKYVEGQGYIWTVDEDAVKEAEQEISDQQREWAQKDAEDAIDDQIDALEDLKDKYQEVIDLIGMSLDDYNKKLDYEEKVHGMTFEELENDVDHYKDTVVSNMKDLHNIEIAQNGVSGVNDFIGFLETAYDFLTKIDTIVKFFNNGEGLNLNGLFGNIFNTLKNGFGDKKNIFSGFVETAKDVAKNVISFFTGKNSGIFPEIISGASDMVPDVEGIVDPNFSKPFENVALDIDSIFSKLWKTIISGASNLSSVVSTILTNLIPKIGNVLTPLGIAGGIIGLGSVIKGAVSAGADAATEKYQEAKENDNLLGQAGWGIVSGALNGLAHPIKSIVNGISTIGKSIGKIFGFASGTKSVKKSGLYNVDEKGPELIVRKPESGRYTYLESGDGVVPANMTNRLFEIASNPYKWLNRYSDGVDNSRMTTSQISYSISIGDIVVENPVGNVDDLSKQIVQKLPMKLKQDLNKR